MRAKEFINEAEVSPYQYDIHSTEEAVVLLKLHCRKTIGQLINHPLWRSMSNHQANVLVIDPSTGVRQSQNTTNHYTELMDNSPYMTDWPKRSQSLICTTSQDRANRFDIANGGQTYAIFPFDGADIAVCPGQDLWDTVIEIPELRVTERINNFNYFLRDLKMPESYDEMVEYVKTPEFAQELDEIVPTTNPNRRPPEKTIDIILRGLSPERTGFRLMTTPELAQNFPKNKEVWLSWPVVAISEPVYHQIIKSGEL